MHCVIPMYVQSNYSMRKVGTKAKTKDQLVCGDAAKRRWLLILLLDPRKRRWLLILSLGIVDDEPPQKAEMIVNLALALGLMMKPNRKVGTQGFVTDRESNPRRNNTSCLLPGYARKSPNLCSARPALSTGSRSTTPTCRISNES